MNGPMELQVEIGALDALLPRVCRRDAAERSPHFAAPLALQDQGFAGWTVASDGSVALVTDRRVTIERTPAMRPIDAKTVLRLLWTRAAREREVEVTRLAAWCSEPIWPGEGTCPECKGTCNDDCKKCGGGGTCSACDQDCPECVSAT